MDTGDDITTKYKKYVLERPDHSIEYVNYSKRRQKLGNRLIAHPLMVEIIEKHQKEARIFIIERQQAMDFELSDWDDFNPNFCCPPYSTFIIRPAQPIPLSYGPKFTKGLAYIPYLEETFVHVTDQYWHAYEYLMADLKSDSSGDKPKKIYLTSGIKIDIKEGLCQPLKLDEDWVGPKEWFSIREKIPAKRIIIDGQLITRPPIYLESQITARNVISFLHLINNRRTQILLSDDPNRPITRQQRRAEGYLERDHYKVTIPPGKFSYNLIQEAVSGKELRYRRPHWVRGHPRTVKGRDEKAWVKPHKRCGEPTYIPDYDAGRIRQEYLNSITE